MQKDSLLSSLLPSRCTWTPVPLELFLSGLCGSQLLIQLYHRIQMASFWYWAKNHVDVLRGSSGTLLNRLSAACPHRTLVKEIHIELHAAGIQIITPCWGCVCHNFTYHHQRCMNHSPFCTGLVACELSHQPHPHSAQIGIAPVPSALLLCC